jgi:hypothetical protein
MLVRAEIEAYQSGCKNMTDEILEKIRGIFPEASRSGDYLYNAQGVVDAEDLQRLCTELDLEAKVKPFKGNRFFTNREGLETRMKQLEGDYHGLKALAESNVAVQIHLPSFALLMFNKVRLLEDCCTDHLQSELNDGWRIIAVCPPLDERRPTYILGKFEPDEKTAVSGRCY